MKTFFLLITFIGLSFVLQAQTDNQHEGLELAEKLNLTNEQVSRIKELNKGMGQRYAGIGNDRSLSGKEKGERKRELALKHKQQIMAILTPEQTVIWDKYYNEKNEGIKNSLTNTLDNKIDVLEEQYKKEKKALEKDGNLGKAEKQRMKDNLKARYKVDKERLKNEKKDVKNTILLDE